MSHLIDTTEMYLRTIYELIEDGVVPMRARIAEHLDHSGPTVSQTIARMERDGLVVVAEDRTLQLTGEGETMAMRVMRKHRLAERLLTDIIGLELPFVHEEACRWEHVMSERVERRLLEILDAPELSPYGNAIPGLAELGEAPVAPTMSGVCAADALEQGATSVTIIRIGEIPQSDPELLALLTTGGVLPGASATLSPDAGDVSIACGDTSVTVSPDVARHVFVSLD